MAMATSPAHDSQAGLVGITGMACRVPGAKTVHEFWQLMKEPRDLRRKMPADRFNVDGFYHPNGQNKGTVCLLREELGDVCGQLTRGTVERTVWVFPGSEPG